MQSVKPSTPRVLVLRAEREAAGQKRREMYLTDAEWQAVQALLAKLRKSEKR